MDLFSFSSDDEIASLKRRELQSLSKANHLKATGKNVELIAALQELWRAQNEKDAPADVAPAAASPVCTDEAISSVDAVLPITASDSPASDTFEAAAEEGSNSAATADLAEVPEAGIAAAAEATEAAPQGASSVVSEPNDAKPTETTPPAAEAVPAVAVPAVAGSMQAASTLLPLPPLAAAAPAPGAGGRYAKAHEKLFAGQTSIASAFSSPQRGMLRAIAVSASKAAAVAARPPLAKTPAMAASAAKLPLGATPALAASDAENSAPTAGVTVASRPCSFVVHKSGKKPTAAEPFNLSGSNGKRPDGFEFRPYSGPIARGEAAALADKTNGGGQARAVADTTSKPPRMSMAPEIGTPASGPPPYRRPVKATPTRADVRDAHLSKAATASKDKRAAHVAALRR